MAGITLAQAQEKLDEYLAAETAVLASQSYVIAGRTMTRANLQFIQDGITVWNQRVQELSRAATGRSRARTISPR